MKTYMESRNDAGLLREYVVKHYGSALTHGACYGVYWQGRRLVRRIAKMAKLPVETVLADIKSDYLNDPEFN